MSRSLDQASDITGGVKLAIRVTPRAQRNEITQILADGTLKIRVTAPPVDGRANAALKKILAEVFRVPINSIKILAGESTRNKLIIVSGVSQEVVNQRIQEVLPKSK